MNGFCIEKELFASVRLQAAHTVTGTCERAWSPANMANDKSSVNAEAFRNWA